MEKEPLVSVIVAVYNTGAYVGKCIKSICNQTYHNLQIIVVNDGSTDDSLRIIKKYKDIDDRIIIISKENEGLGFCRRDGLKLADGEYVVFVDSDDYLLHTAIEDLVGISEKYQVDSVIGNCIRKYGPLKKHAKFGADIPINVVLQNKELMDKYYISFFGVNILPVRVWGCIYRKSVIDKAMLNSFLYHRNFSRFGEDIFFNLMLFPYLKSLYVLEKPVCIYRYGGMTSRYNENFKALFNLSDVRVKLLDKYNLKEGYKLLFIEYKNYIYSELLQRIQYLHQDKNTLIDFLRVELNNRYSVKRMKEFYNDACPDSLKPLIEDDYESIYLHAVDMAEANKWRFMLKKVLTHITSFLK